jgi:ABC-type transporter Mla subunit MlaD
MTKRNVVQESDESCLDSSQLSPVTADLEVVKLVEHGLDLAGNPTTYDVRKCCTTVDQVQEAIVSARAQHPELNNLLSVVASLLCTQEDVMHHVQAFLTNASRLAGEHGDSQVTDDIANIKGMTKRGHEFNLYLH